MRIGLYPSPVTQLDVGGGRLWAKRDDRVAEVYGGNKVRKLERLFEAAEAHGQRRVLTLGAAGSHQVVAAAVYGAARGMTVEAVLVPQPFSEHAAQNLRIALGHGLVVHTAPAWSAAPAVLAAHLARDVRGTCLIPLGGSNVLGTVGYVEAARELAAQIAEGLLPEPDVVVVGLGSGGTAAGLAVGLEEVGLRARVLGVAVSHPARALEAMTRHLARSTAVARGSSKRAAGRIDVDRRWIGRAYGVSTPESEAAMREAAQLGLTLDPTYTAKAFACALDRTRTGTETVLFWHTYSTAPLAPLLARALSAVPEALAGLLPRP